jgi:hypothetical protein
MQKKILLHWASFSVGKQFTGKCTIYQKDSTYKKWFVGTSLFVLLGNFDTKNPPNLRST